MTPDHLVLLLTAVIGVVLPLVVTVVTKQLTDARVKTVLLAALSAVTGLLSAFLTALNGHTAFDWFAAVVGAVLAFVTGVSTQWGVYAQFGTNAAIYRALRHAPAPTPAPAPGPVVVPAGAAPLRTGLWG